MMEHQMEVRFYHIPEESLGKPGLVEIDPPDEVNDPPKKSLPMLTRSQIKAKWEELATTHPGQIIVTWHGQIVGCDNIRCAIDTHPIERRFEWMYDSLEQQLDDKMAQLKK